MDTDFFNLAPCEKESYDCVQKESKVELKLMTTEDWKDDFTANTTTKFFF